jgi:hypothetical protein
VEIRCSRAKTVATQSEGEGAHRQKMSFYVRVSGWMASKGLPRKVMDVGYFAETKGVVGYHYKRRLASKMRHLRRFLN